MNNLDEPPSDSNIQGIDCGHSREPQRGYFSPAQQPITWSGILTRLTLCAAVALSLYALIVGLLINPYILRGSTAGRVVGVYEGYDSILRHRHEVKDTNTIVLFWGSSMVREGVDCAQLESDVAAVSAYNLAVSGDIPCRRLVELPRVQALHPQMVIIGVSYPEVFEDRLPFEDQISALPASAYEELSPAAREILPERLNQLANRPEWERFLWKRKFFLSAVFSTMGVEGRGDQLRPGHSTEFKAPWVYQQGIKTEELQRFLTLRKNVYPPYTSGTQSEPSSTLAARSLTVLVRGLEQQGCEVTLVNMPLHPMLNEVVPGERRAALNRFLATLRSDQVTVFDYQDKLPAASFVDFVHMNSEGRTAFTRSMAELLVSPPMSARTKHFTQADRAL